MDLKRYMRPALPAAALALLCITGFCVSAARSAEPGRHCFASEGAIGDNLPFGETSHATEITAIQGVFDSASRQMAGWLYTTRNRSYFIQVASPRALSAVLRHAGEEKLAAQFAGASRFAYYPLPTRIVASFRRMSSEILLASCYGTGP